MGVTTKSNAFYPEVFEDAIAGAFPDIKALAGTGAAIVNTAMPWGGERAGESVKVPYFGSLGKMEDITTDGSALTPRILQASKEEALVRHSGLSFEMTKWAMDGIGDPYAEAARQIVEAAERRIDDELITLAKQSTLVVDDSSNTISYDAFVNARMLFGDQQNDIALTVVTSKVYGDMMKLKDGYARPLLVDPVSGGLPSFLGIPVFISDALSTSAFSAVTAAGTTPPTVTVSGTPASAAYRIVVKATKAGALETSEIVWSSDGGVTFSAPVVTAATVVLGDTGATIAIAAGAAATDNVWTFQPAGVQEVVICKKGALVAWLNGSPSVQTDKDILADTSIGAVHMYWVAHRYGRLPGSSKGGVARLKVK